MANARVANSLALAPGTDLIGEFRIERVLGAGGFGMTYLATETALARAVTIKEYLPTDFAQRGPDNAVTPRDDESVTDFQWGLDRFIDEAQTLARFDHPHIVRVFRYFRANGTAYMVLSFEEGESLKGWLKSLNRAPRQRELDEFLAPLLDALETIHAADYLHRDIAPDNIIIRKDGTPVLIDFGSARGEIAARTRTVSALVKPGYSPYEQYAESGARQGPWTDIYALGATLYHAICGRRPPDAPSRVVRDDLVPVREAVLATYRPRFLDAVSRAITLDPALRPQSIKAWRGDLLAPEPAKPSWFRRTTTGAAEDRHGAAAKTVPLPGAQGPLPPPPDVPGAPGQMLDFIEGLQQKPVAAAAEFTPAADVAKAPTTAPRLNSKPSRPPAPVPAVLVRKPKPAVAKAKPPRPRAMPGKGVRWRSFALKFAVGAGLATGALYYNDSLPVGDTARSTVTTVPTKPANSSRSAANGALNGSGAGSASSTHAGTQSAAPSANASALASRPRAEAPIRTSSVRESAEAEPPRETALRVAVPVAAPQAPARPRPTMLSGHRGGTTAVEFTPDGGTVVTAGADATLKVWNAATGDVVRTIALKGVAIAVAVDDKRVLTGHADGRMSLLAIDTGATLQTYKRGDAAITAVGFMREGGRLVSAGQDSTLAIWDPEQPSQPVEVTEAHDGGVAAVAVSPRSRLVASGGADNHVRLWRSATLDLVRTYRGHRETISALAFSPNGRYLAAAAMDGRIRVWSTTSSSLYRLSSAHKSGVRGLAFSPDGSLIASAGEDGSVQLWQLRQGRSIRSLAENGAPARGLAFAPDGSRAAVASTDGTVRFWDAGPVGRAGR